MEWAGELRWPGDHGPPQRFGEQLLVGPHAPTSNDGPTRLGELTIILGMTCWSKSSPPPPSPKHPPVPERGPVHGSCKSRPRYVSGPVVVGPMDSLG